MSIGLLGQKIGMTSVYDAKGRSSYSMEPSHFQPVPPNLVPAILDQKEAK